MKEKFLVYVVQFDLFNHDVAGKSCTVHLEFVHVLEFLSL